MEPPGPGVGAAGAERGDTARENTAGEDTAREDAAREAARRRRRRDEIFGEVDRPAPAADRRRDDELTREVPPHHG